MILDTLKPPRIKVKGKARAEIDWNELFEIWFTTTMTIEDFLDQYGIKHTAILSRQMTNDWARRRAQKTIRMKADALETARREKADREREAERQANLKKVQEGTKAAEDAKKPDVTVLELDEQKREVGAPQEYEPSELMIARWRKRQGEEDYTTANALRQHIKLKLKQAIAKDEHGQTYSKLSKTDISTFAKSLADLQKIQRLALGMSTDNIDVAQKSIVEKQKSDDVPTFEVELNDNGKFKRPRPRRIKGGS